MIEITAPLLGQAAVCEPILRRRSAWFGIEAALQGYARAVDVMPTLLARDAEAIVGFLTIKSHTAFAAKIYVMAVDAAHARRVLGVS